MRMLNTARALARRHEVDILIVTDHEDDGEVHPLREEFSTVRCVSRPVVQFYMNSLRGMASRKPLQTFYYRAGEAAAWLDRNADRYDLFFVNHVRTAEYVRSREEPKVIDLVDAISRNYEQASRYASGLWRFIYPIEARRLRRYEPRIVDDFDHTLITTDAGRGHLRREGAVGPITVVPNGVEEKLLSIDSQFEVGNERVAFLGKMDYAPNVDAVKYFVEEILPRIRRRTNCQFTVVGAPVDERIKRLADHSDVEVTGFVEDPSDYLIRARVVVAPLRFGAGIQNKILEAMALGRPVVTTPLGAEGIDAVDGEHLLVGNDAEDFATAVINLLSNAESASRIGHAARKLIQKHYRWEAVGKQIIEIVDDVLM